MSRCQRRLVCAITFTCCTILHAADLRAEQRGFEIAPVGGYRFGGDFFELVAGQEVDLDGAPAAGVAASVPLGHGLHLEGVFTRQKAHLSTPGGPFTPPARWHITVDHYGVGGLREFRDGNVRPFLNSVFGLTHYASEGDREVRFSFGAGGGVKLFPSRRIGVRLDARSFWTFVDAEGDFWACVSGVGCSLNFNVQVVWQAEFTAGLIFRFP
jgi:hypothetical protein